MHSSERTRTHILGHSYSWPEVMRHRRPGWYVDSVRGNDANTGRSISSPLATIAALLAKPIAAGDYIYLARGSHWREQLTVPADYVQVRAYGTGASPILDCSNIVSNGQFSPEAGTNHVYKATISPEIAAINTWISVWEDNVRLVRANSIAECDATPGSYYPSADIGTPPITLYVHASDSSSIPTNGKVYECSWRPFGIEAFERVGVKVAGIECRRNLHHDGSIRMGCYSQLYGCIARDGMKHNVYARTGSRLERVQAIDAYFGGTTLSLYIYCENNPNGEGVQFIDCTAEIANPVGGSQENVIGFHGHKNVGGSFGTVIFQGCIGRNLSMAYSGGDASLEFKSCIVEECNIGWSTWCSTLIEDCMYSLSAAVGGYRVIASNDNAHMTIRDLTVSATDNTDAAFLISNPITVDIDGLDINIAGGAGWGSALFVVTAVSANLKVRNASFTGARQPYNVTSGATLDSDYNYFADPFYDFDIGGASYTTFADYRASTGQDSHSTVS